MGSRNHTAQDDLAAIEQSLGPVDARNIVSRIRGLIDAGEQAGSVLVRLNAPARLPASTYAVLEGARESVLDRTLIEVRRDPVVMPPPSTPMRSEKREDLKCVPCGGFFSRIVVRGRKPTRCPGCR